VGSVRIWWRQWWPSQASLAEQVQHLSLENERLKAEQRYFETLQRQLRVLTLAHFESQPALVVGRPLDTLRSQLVVNRGRSDGVVLNAPVVAYDGVLIGFVREVLDDTAVVTLLFHPEAAVAAEVLGEGEHIVRGLVTGKHYTAVWLTTVPRDQRLARSQRVVTAAQDGRVPYGLLIGSVADIEQDEAQAYQSASLTLPYDADDIEVVTILLPLGV
jgi:rod shape-determining protein MreC